MEIRIMKESDRLNGRRKGKRKRNTNLTLSAVARKAGDDLCKATHRRSLTNLVEHLIIEAHLKAFAPKETAVVA